MLTRLAPRPSLVASAMMTGFRLRRQAFTHIVTVLSVMPEAIFASVLPVQGETITASKPPRVMVSSASLMLRMIFLPVSSPTVGEGARAAEACVGRGGDFGKGGRDVVM